MRLLLLTQYFWPENFGINALAGALCSRGIEVTVLTGQPNYPDGRVFPGYSAWRVSREDFGGVEVLRMPLCPRGKHSALQLALNYLSFIVAGYAVGPWLLRRRRFDAVFVYAPSPLLQALPAIWLAWLKRAPTALWVQDLWPESLSATGFVKSRVALNVVRQAIRFIYRHVERILVPSAAFRCPIQALGADPAKIFFFPNPHVESSLGETKSPAAQALAADVAKGFSIVFAGNLGAAQSLETIIEAAQRLQQTGKGIRFFLVGSGGQSEWLAQEIARRSLNNVVLPGRFPLADMPCIYAAASVLLVSLRDEPIFTLTIPSKVQGYLAAGKPIIASLNGEGARIVAEAGAGIACAAGNPQALAEAILTLFRLDANKRAEMGENARNYAVRHFSLDRLAAELEAQLEALVAANREKRR
jgi:glycosyltransferase involved in cell wall biosynthesis